jgi:hypothetical protein
MDEIRRMAHPSFNYSIFGSGVAEASVWSSTGLANPQGIKLRRPPYALCPDSSSAFCSMSGRPQRPTVGPRPFPFSILVSYQSSTGLANPHRGDETSASPLRSVPDSSSAFCSMSGRPQRPTASHRVFPSLILVSYQFKDGTWEKGIQMATQALDQFEIESPNDLFLLRDFLPGPA